MKFFIDTANIDHIREACSWGIVAGCTTNPSIIAKEGRDFVEAIAEICEIVDGPVSAETVGETAEEMVKQGRLLAKVHPNVVIKVPLTTEGIKTCATLASEGIRVNVTLCFSSAQALLAARAGATYISPFIGRLDDLSHNGMSLIEEIADIFSAHPDIETEILAASCRHPLHVSQAALSGADVATVPYAVLRKMFNHPLTDIGNERFTADWETVENNDIVGQVTDWLVRNGRS